MRRLLLGRHGYPTSSKAAADAIEPGRDLFLEWNGSGALISDITDSPFTHWELLRTLGMASGDSVVLISPRARRRRKAATVLRAVANEVLANIAGDQRAHERNRIWLAGSSLGDPNGPGAQWLTSLTAKFGVELLAPDGPIAVVAGGGLYAGTATGASGWRTFRADGPGPALTSRYPLPEWDQALPRKAVVLGGAVAAPVPAGLVLRPTESARLTADDLAFMIPMDLQHPALVIAYEGVPPVAVQQVAALFRTLTPRMSLRLIVSPGMAGRVDSEWLASLAALVYKAPLDDVAVAGQSPPLPYREPALLGGQWVRRTARLYRMGDDVGLVAEVMPAGIVVRPGGVYTSDAVAIFNPLWSTITVGTPGLEVPPVLVDALERLLIGPTRPALINGRTTARPARARHGAVGLLVAGDADRAVLLRLARLADLAGLTPQPAHAPTRAVPAPPVRVRTPAVEMPDVRMPDVRMPEVATPVRSVATPDSPPRLAQPVGHQPTRAPRLLPAEAPPTVTTVEPQDGVLVAEGSPAPADQSGPRGRSGRS